MLFVDIYFSVLDKTWFKVYKMVDPSKLSESLTTAVDIVSSSYEFQPTNVSSEKKRRILKRVLYVCIKPIDIRPVNDGMSFTSRGWMSIVLTHTYKNRFNMRRFFSDETFVCWNLN